MNFIREDFGPIKIVVANVDGNNMLMKTLYPVESDDKETLPDCCPRFERDRLLRKACCHQTTDIKQNGACCWNEQKT